MKEGNTCYNYTMTRSYKHRQNNLSEKKNLVANPLQMKRKKGDHVGLEAGEVGPTLNRDNRGFTKFWPCEAASVKLTSIQERSAGIPGVSPAEGQACWSSRMYIPYAEKERD